MSGVTLVNFMAMVLRSKVESNLYPCGADLEALCDACGLDIYSNIDQGDDDLIHGRLKVYKVHTWRCTDTLVGLFAYFLDDEFVCISMQKYRKSKVDIRFASNDAGDKVAEFLKSFVTSMTCKYRLIGADCMEIFK